MEGNQNGKPFIDSGFMADVWVKKQAVEPLRRKADNPQGRKLRFYAAVSSIAAIIWSMNNKVSIK